MDIDLQSEALRLKSILNKINDVSYSYAQLNKTMPFSMAKNNDDLAKLIRAYKRLLDDFTSYMKTTNYENTDSVSADVAR